MLTIKKTTDADYECFLVADDQKQDFDSMLDFFYGREKKYCVTFFKDDVPVLLIGMAEKWDRVYDTFTIYSKFWKPIYFRSVFSFAKSFFEGFDCDRIEHMISCDRPWTEKTANFFGFKYNTTLRKYINGKDFKLYEMVK